MEQTLEPSERGDRRGHSVTSHSVRSHTIRSHSIRRFAMSKYAKLSAGLLAAWLAFSLLSSALHLYANAPNTPPIALGLAVVTPIVLFLVWFASSPEFREFILSLSPRSLPLVQG